jgi:hypothetical protein
VEAPLLSVVVPETLAWPSGRGGWEIRGSSAFGDVTGGSDEAGIASRESGCARDLGAGSGELETNPKPRAV